MEKLRFFLVQTFVPILDSLLLGDDDFLLAEEGGGGGASAAFSDEVARPVVGDER